MYQFAVSGAFHVADDIDDLFAWVNAAFRVEFDLFGGGVRVGARGAVYRRGVYVGLWPIALEYKPRTIVGLVLVSVQRLLAAGVARDLPA